MNTWILYWVDGNSETIKGDKFYKTFLEKYKVSDISKLHDYEWLSGLPRYKSPPPPPPPKSRTIINKE